MKKLLLTTALVMLATPVLAKEYTIKEISNPAGENPYYFEPSDLAIQPGDTVTFMNAQDEMHDVMFEVVPMAVTETMIMSPMFEKEGEKWSYTFTVPGTYTFHCHPHQALGMKGSLIVGEASKPGETKKMSHEMREHADTNAVDMDHGDHHHAVADLPEGTGRINSIDAEKHTVNITHGPVADLQWPGMTMDFPVAKDVDLSGFKTGDSVEFGLKADDSSQYSIVSLKPAH